MKLAPSYPGAGTVQGHVKVVSRWSTGACSRFPGGQLAARPERASELAHSIIRRDLHDPVILQLRNFDVPLRRRSLFAFLCYYPNRCRED